MAPFRPICANPIVLSNETSVALPQSSTSAGKQRRHHHPATDWENIKPTIIRLYIEEKKKLEDVIKILQSDFDFRTGRRQLYIKLQEWKIHKNNNRRGRDIRNITRSALGRQRDSLSPIIISPAYLNTPMLLQQWPGSSLPAPDLMILDSLPDDHHTPQWYHSNTNDLMPRSLTPMAIRTRSPSPTSGRSYDPMLLENQESIGLSPQVLQEMNILVANNRDQLDSSPTSAVEEIVSHLLESATNRIGVIYYRDALPLKEDLKRFLDLSRTIEILPRNCAEPLGHSSLGEELDIVYELITSARRIGFNVDISLPYKTVSSGRIRWQRKQAKLRIGTGIITIIAKSGKHVQCVQHSEGFGGRYRLLSAKIRTRLCYSTQAFELEVNDWELPDGSFSSIPRITAYNVVPYNSLVFQIASWGRVEDLIALLSNGQASLHDRDEEGWSLLHYSLENPEMCRFLAQKGLDVDEPVLSRYWRWGRGSKYSTPLHECLVHNLNPQVARILLSEGADPTISVAGADSVITTVPHVFGTEYHEVFRQIFHQSHYFELTRAKDYLGQTILLNACQPRYYLAPGCYLVSPEMHIKFLLDQGSSIQDRGCDGSNCLHLFFRSDLFGRLHQDWTDALVYLVRHGADVFASDNSGTTVSQIAYAENTCCNWQESYCWCGSYRGDLWDFILHLCGYNILDFRMSCHPRRARYTSLYTRQAFEELWKDREDQCPYWDDNEWPPLDRYGEAYDSKRDQKILCVCRKGGRTRWIKTGDDPKACREARRFFDGSML
ncbi:ankyrin repeat-containing domain protein [Nemania sp. FL0031]|nr:ankyrin repeat-containing domain protein [Nemania sp. FL0031]